MINFVDKLSCKKTALIASFLAAALTIGLSIPQAIHDKNNEKIFNSESLKAHPVKFFEEDLFYRGISQLSSGNTQVQPVIKGVVVPHHYVASYMLADLFAKLSIQEAKNIILIGPNHHESRGHSFLTSEYAWATSFGLVEPASDIIQRLTNDKITAVNEDVLVEEHSIAGLMPFVKYYLPDARVVPIILKRYISREEMDKLVASLADIASKPDTVIVASVDFSHYLNAKEADVKDLETRKLIEKEDYPNILNLNSDYLDSPGSLVVLMKNLGWQWGGDWMPESGRIDYQHFEKTV